MNKVLPNQTNWSNPTSHVQPRRREDFAEKLHAKSQEDSRRPETDHPATTRDSTTSATLAKGLGSRSLAESGVGEWEKSVTSDAGASSMLESGNAGTEGGSESALEVLGCEGAFTPPIGLLSGMMTWSRVFPEHLIASGYLSVVDMAARNGNVPSEQAAPAAWCTDTHESDVNAATRLLDLSADARKALATSSFDASRQPIANTGAIAASAIESEVVSLSRVSDAVMPADHFWAERLMRLTQDGDGGSTIWLRDYGLKEDELEHIAAKLRQRGQQGGVLISRVVINGCEIWRAVASEGER